MNALRHILSVAGCLLMPSACAPVTSSLETLQTMQSTNVTVTPLRFSTMPEWDGERIEPSLQQFKVACGKGFTNRNKPLGMSLVMPTPMQWQTICHAAQRVQPGRRSAEQFFETYFTPYRISRGQDKALFTGYYIPLLQGSLTQSDQYRWPVYGLPQELVNPNGAPFFTRQQINDGALKGRGLEIAWVNDPVMLFFAQVQGSARMRLPDGRVVLLQFAGKNGQPYVAIGRVLVQRGEMTQQEVSLPSIKRWLEHYPEQAQALMEENPSFVFFKLVEQAPAITGAHGSVLKAEYSLATDPAYIPLGAPVLVSTVVPDPMAVAGTMLPFKRVMIAQDVGTAITGPLRGDIFFGEGKEAEFLAGHQRGEGSIILLWPNAGR